MALPGLPNKRIALEWRACTEAASPNTERLQFDAEYMASILGALQISWMAAMPSMLRRNSYLAAASK